MCLLKSGRNNSFSFERRHCLSFLVLTPRRPLQLHIMNDIRFLLDVPLFPCAARLTHYFSSRIVILVVCVCGCCFSPIAQLYPPHHHRHRSLRFLLLYNTRRGAAQRRFLFYFLASLNVINEATMTHSGSIAVTGCADRGSSIERKRRAVMHNCRFSLTLFALASIVDERLGRFL